MKWEHSYRAYLFICNRMFFWFAFCVCRLRFKLCGCLGLTAGLWGLGFSARRVLMKRSLDLSIVSYAGLVFEGVYGFLCVELGASKNSGLL